MSSGQKHRDPWNFPCMKWRAKRRLTGPQRLTVILRSQRTERDARIAEQEYAFYAREEHQQPQGSARRRAVGNR